MRLCCRFFHNLVEGRCVQQGYVLLYAGDAVSLVAEVLAAVVVVVAVVMLV